SEVSCVFMESCILPCSFQGDTDVIIHWNNVTAGNSPVHSFYYEKDQLAHQDQRFRNRTSLFKDQISGGNASLQLTGLQVQDQGRYKCYTSTTRGNDGSFINLKVDENIPHTVTPAPQAFLNVSNTETTIPCAASNSSFKSLIWRFNHSQIVLTQTRADVSSSVSEGWSQQVKGVSESGSLMLQNLSPHHEGTYTCELSDAEETLITNTFLRIQSPGEAA
ncbi:V-set domain-containing T-cell activation inhibitor 1-like, partial [Seriola lalandi dorsalis]|uniref:V-set domain-containing T-cell activation inhibitor 1-like n=1 Tax=Seriola lalandi dorsalis TaxID=1841481 RepID=UPI000C6FBDE8